jgi:hypothetical protein
MTVKGFVDYNNLKEYDEQIKKYIDKKLAEAIEAYRTEDEANDNIFNDQTDNDEKI